MSAFPFSPPMRISYLKAPFHDMVFRYDRMATPNPTNITHVKVNMEVRVQHAAMTRATYSLSLAIPTGPGRAADRRQEVFSDDQPLLRGLVGRNQAGHWVCIAHEFELASSTCVQSCDPSNEVPARSIYYHWSGQTNNRSLLLSLLVRTANFRPAPGSPKQ